MNKEILLTTLTAVTLTSTLFAEETLPVKSEVEPIHQMPWESKQTFSGFAQVGVEMGDGAIGDEQNGDYKFKADRVRILWKYFSGPVGAKVMLDFVQAGDDNNGVGLPDVVKDAFISYKFDDALFLKAGMMKAPLGMSWTTAGWNLSVVKRAFDKKLAFERTFGLMLSGRDIGFGNKGKVTSLEAGHERPWKGFGYDLMIAGQAGRSGAVVNAKTGDDNAYIGRVMFDWTELLHIEASYGVSKSAGGIDNDTDREDYKAFNAGLDSHYKGMSFESEYYNVENIRGVKGWDMNTLALTLTYPFSPTFEFAMKDVRGTETLDGVDSDAVNTYVGFNYYIHTKNTKMDRMSRKKRNRHRVQMNYVFADVDDSFKGVGGLYRANALLLQYQFKF